MSHYVHSSPGRMRVKIPLAKGNPRLAERIEGAVGSLEGVNCAALSTLTGSLVVNYSPETVTPQDILGRLRERGHIDPRRTVSLDDRLTGAVSQAGQAMTRALVSVFVDQALSNSGLSFLAILI